MCHQDETWLNAGHGLSTVWTDMTVASHNDAFVRGLTTGLKHLSVKGQRLIVMRTGSKDGIVGGCMDVFHGKRKLVPTTRRWMAPALKGALMQLQGSVIVMGNALYDSQLEDPAPTTASCKGIIWD